MKMSDEPCRLCLAKSIPLNAKACQTAFLVNQLGVAQFVARVRFPVEMLMLQVAKKTHKSQRKEKQNEKKRKHKSDHFLLALPMAYLAQRLRLGTVAERG